MASEDISTSINSFDYLAMNAKLIGKIFDFSLTADTDIKTLNPDRFYDAFSGDLNLIRNIYSYRKVEDEILNNGCSVNSELFLYSLLYCSLTVFKSTIL